MEHHSAENDQNQSSAGKYCQLHSLVKKMKHRIIKMAGSRNNFHQLKEIRMEFDEKIVIKVDHPAHALEIFKNYEKLPPFDVELITEDDSVGLSAHRMVLAGASDYFSAMITTGFIEKNQKQIKIKDVTGKSLKLLVKYCYTGQIEINSRNVVDLMASASMLRFEKIEKECRNFFDKHLEAHPKSRFGIYLIAQKYSFTKLAMKSFDILMKRPDLNEIDFSLMERILDSEWFNVTEREIFEMAMKWVDFNRSKRRKFIPNILKIIRLPQIDPTYLFEIIKPICESNDCFELLVDALYWHTLPESKRLGLLPVKQTTKRSGSLKMVVIGGNWLSESISMESYCPRSRKWILGDEIKRSMDPCFFKLVIIHETVYGIGEKDFSQDLLTRNISRLAPMLALKHNYSVVVVNNFLYAIGGTHDLVASSSVERYDTTRDRWESCAPMLEPRYFAGVTVLNDYLYVFGGDGETGDTLKSVERYSISNNTWSFVKSMNFHRYGLGAAVLGEKIYAIGGCDEDSLDSVEWYDPSTDTWTMVASLLIARGCINTAIYEGEIFAIGRLESNDVERYNADENKWIKCESLNCSRAYPVVAFIQNY